jgi:hypothetical protein
MEHRQAKRQNTIRRYMAGRLSTIEREDFEQHYFECAECADSVRDLVLSGAFEEEKPRRETVLPEWLRGFWSWRPTAAQLLVPACLLLVFTSYEALTARGRVAPQAVEAIHLAPDTRSADPAIGQRAGGFVVLTVDVPEIAQQWKWRIRSADRADILLEGVASASAGGVVNLLVPVSNFTPGKYILSVQDSASIAPEIAYRFRML